MAPRIKALLKSSSMYSVYRTWLDTRALRSWQAQDDVRLEFYRQLIRPADLVFDIGANVGNRSKVFLKIGARVVAFEPLSHCCNVLRKGLADSADFRVVQGAIGDKPGEAELKIGDAHFLATLSDGWISAMHRSGRFRTQRWDRAERVAVTTFDAAIREFGTPAFTKIDVEGFEAQVLAGLSSPIPGGSLEYLTESIDATLTCIEKLCRLDSSYRFQFSSGETMRFDWPDWLEPAATRAALARVAQRDRSGWGDLYFRSERHRTPLSAN